MVYKYIRYGLRSLKDNGSYVLINVLGLTLGITFSIIIFLIISFELSFDTYHPNSDTIYRVVIEYTNTTKAGYNSGTTYPLPEALRTDFPDPERVVLVDANIFDVVISIPGMNGSIEKFKERKLCFADPEYFNMFHYDWIAGNPNALYGEKTVVITESVAKKYFNDEPALNRVINLNNQYDVTVTGVVKDPPQNTDLPFTIIVSSNLGSDKRGWDNWGSTSSALNCFVQLKPGTTQNDFDAKLKGWHTKYYTGEDAEFAPFVRYFLQPLDEMHFDTRFHVFSKHLVSKDKLLTLGIIGVLLLLTACVNFINLNTVLIVSRSKETGIRKMMGCSRLEISLQFLGETFLITFLSLILSFLFVELAAIFLAPVLGYQLTFNPFSSIETAFFITLLPIVVTLLAGLYPAARLSGIQTIRALKNKLDSNSQKGLFLRKSLIVFQLVISQSLVVATIVIVNQLNYWMTKPLGLDSRAVIEFDIPERKPEQIQQLTERLKNIPGVENATISNGGSIASGRWSLGFETTVNDHVIKESAQLKFIDSNYIDTYGLQLASGRNLMPSDTSNVILINDEFVKMLGLNESEEALGRTVKVFGINTMIVGVLKNFNTQPLSVKLEPVIFMANNVSNYFLGGVRMSTIDARQTLLEVQRVWESIYPNYVFEYTFLDDKIEQFYEAERKNSYMVGIFAGVAILVGCIGLYALIAFMARSRIKEVGIRKTLGASVTQIISLYAREFVVLLVISFIISAPITYYFLEQWLKNFAYRIHPEAGSFILGAFITITIVLTTIGVKSYKAAIANPVEALKYE